MWYKIGRIAPYVFLYALSFLVVGLFNFVTAEVRTDILTSAEFWNKTISQNLANLIVFSTTITLYNTRNMEEDKDYLQMDKLVLQHQFAKISNQILGSGYLIKIK